MSDIMFITSIQGITLQTFSTMSRLSSMQIIEALRTPWDGLQRAAASLTVQFAWRSAGCGGCVRAGMGQWMAVCVCGCRRVPFKVTNEQLKDDACTYTIRSVQNKTALLICLENVPIFSYCVYRCGVVPSGWKRFLSASPVSRAPAFNYYI